MRLADEPTNIMWEGHERETEKKNNFEFTKILLSVLLTVVVIIGLNYGVSAWTDLINRKYESRCFGDTVSDTEFNEAETSIGCFCEQQFENYEEDLEYKTFMYHGTEEFVC